MDIIRISEHMTSRGRVETLGAALEVPHYKITAALYDNPRHITEAGLTVLYDFRRTVETAEEAFRLMWEGLVQAGMEEVAWKVLGKESDSC